MDNLDTRWKGDSHRTTMKFFVGELKKTWTWLNKKPITSLTRNRNSHDHKGFDVIRTRRTNATMRSMPPSVKDKKRLYYLRTPGWLAARPSSDELSPDSEGGIFRTLYLVAGHLIFLSHLWCPEQIYYIIHIAGQKEKTVPRSNNRHTVIMDTI